MNGLINRRVGSTVLTEPRRECINNDSEDVKLAEKDQIRKYDLRYQRNLYISGWIGIIAAFVSIIGIVVQRHFNDEVKWKHGCKQCASSWWDNFWHWRLSPEGLKEQPPYGMAWEWRKDATLSGNYTDWWGASMDLTKLLMTKLDPNGHILQIGCGDSPVVEFLYKSGFRNIHSVDISPQVVSLMQLRYPSKQWPGLSFESIDFLEDPKSQKDFSTVIDKAGIWDWLQEEKPSELERLLSNVRQALLPVPGEDSNRKRYVIMTKQSPEGVRGKIAGSGFVVDVAKSMQGGAWTYVLTAES